MTRWRYQQGGIPSDAIKIYTDGSRLSDRAESEFPDWWTWKEKVGGARLAGFGGNENQVQNSCEQTSRLVCYWSSDISEKTLYWLYWCSEETGEL
ncbi:hypothetical protein TNIN_145011 [Trichonephila inaurata madagascariensis]|uniref:Uncharacterized protein n=1 Tax=Trichonephila inaurata madagascariensis TaxID=2747483 RepID=A0A8X7CQ43_9ARAC|nr:hypothetical protein TNIN_145011 [Trichonephila inaurata madagascariensis]